MEYVGYVFGIFGLMAFLQVSSLKGRVEALERALAGMQGTSYHDERQALLSAARKYIGQKVMIRLKEDHADADIISYGNTKHGSNTILDADDEWLDVLIETPKGNKEKLIRLESVESISKTAE